MGRRKMTDGAANPQDGLLHMFLGERDNTPKCRVADAEGAHHCSECGRTPKIHDIGFLHPEEHPKHFYLACECGKCDGEWHLTTEDAVKSWNLENPSADRPLMSFGHEDSTDAFNKVFKGGFNV